MKRFFYLIFLIPVFQSGCDKPPVAPQPPEPPIVTVANPIEQELAPYLEFVGRTEAEKAVDIVPEVSGLIRKINFKEGSVVSAGQLLYEIDPTPYKATFERAIAEIANTKAQLALAEAELSRNRAAAASGSVSKDELDRAVAKRDSAEAIVKAAEADSAKASFNLEKTQIKAGITGRIERTRLTEGNLVTANTTSLTRIVTINPIHVYYDIDEMTSLRYRKMIFKDKSIPDPRDVKPLRAWMKLKNEDIFSREGLVDYIGPEVNRASATRQIRAVFKNEDNYISPGDSIRIRVEAGPTRKAIMIPESAIASQQGKKFVYTIDADKKAMMTFVELGEVREGLQVVEKGLTVQDRVVINGLLRVRPGVTVNPVNVSPGR